MRKGGHGKEPLDPYDLFAKDGGLGLHEFDKDCGKAVKQSRYII